MIEIRDIRSKVWIRLRLRDTRSTSSKISCRKFLSLIASAIASVSSNNLKNLVSFCTAKATCIDYGRRLTHMVRSIESGTAFSSEISQISKKL
ncbi:hypothetical protein ABEB36_003791 [Hypothenemus hampei]|uniref:Uncharacterized protein n=1 Tax=Hypothenemus hampei TaxID=57062 RepID=A0ABD1F149_HYPHA